MFPRLSRHIQASLRGAGLGHKSPDVGHCGPTHTGASVIPSMPSSKNVWLVPLQFCSICGDGTQKPSCGSGALLLQHQSVCAYTVSSDDINTKLIKTKQNTENKILLWNLINIFPPWKCCILLFYTSTTCLYIYYGKATLVGCNSIQINFHPLINLNRAELPLFKSGVCQ